ncbi:hypothetical protein [Parageobacillus galactosidasius]|uniref:Uncharacterized protein n=1 Tax=Parageobacillus galactosidasius TaxID=883812 RepID=A0A226QKV8_9BACL|nr:hypothetical protein [Parageobacillus galactosidasius]OXB93005.1 hypothetical protein B9L23_17940 [Parageobacillus galactosidasius]
MSMIQKEPDIVIKEINERIDDLEKLISLYEQKQDVYNSFNSWRSNVKRTLSENFSEPSISRDFLIETKVVPNKFSRADTISKVGEALQKSKDILSKLKSDVESGKYLPEKSAEDHIDKTMAVTIIRKILKNFHKHIEAMYQDEVHGNGTIKKEDLDKIKIGNEYDVQRILYSLIRPIFPDARFEVVNDAGYASVRYDIVLDEYGIVIEIKCTRENMTERKLTEELGADSFHYEADHLFLFIFDKVKLIKNPDAFEKAFRREKQGFDKELETIIIREITF